jgi:hypothetical protein
MGKAAQATCLTKNPPNNNKEKKEKKKDLQVL